MQKNEIHSDFLQFDTDDQPHFNRRQRRSSHHPLLYLLIAVTTFTICGLVLSLCYLQNKANGLQKENEELAAMMSSHSQMFTQNEEIDVLEQVLYPYRTDIIENIEELNLLRDWAGKGGLMQIYKASVDGMTSEIFHKKTENYRKLLLVMKTYDKSTKTTHRFGAFTRYNFKPTKFRKYLQDQLKQDKSGFIFSLDEQTKTDVTNVMENVQKEVGTFIRGAHETNSNHCSKNKGDCLIMEIEVYKVFYYDE